MKKVVLGNLAKVTGKHPWFAKFLRTPFFTEHLWTTASRFSLQPY